MVYNNNATTSWKRQCWCFMCSPLALASVEAGFSVPPPPPLAAPLGDALLKQKWSHTVISRPTAPLAAAAVAAAATERTRSSARKQESDERRTKLTQLPLRWLDSTSNLCWPRRNRSLSC